MTARRRRGEPSRQRRRTFGDFPTWAEFPPHVLREYALLADGRRGGLVGPRGDLVWLCAPRWDSDALIAGLVGGNGIYAVTPTDPYVWGGYYEEGSLIWRSRWTTTSTSFECRESLALPADPHTTIVLRRIEAVEDDAHARVALLLAAGFGAHAMRQVRQDDDGTWTMRAGDTWVRWTGAPDARPDEDGTLRTDVKVRSGDHHDLVLEISDRPLDRPVDVDALWRSTEEAWRRCVPAFDDSVAPRDARQAYAVLSGLTTPGGGMVAAATLGLPERAETGRNYDYRYVWLRDQAYAGLAAGVGHPHPLLDAAVADTTARVLEHGDKLAPAYRVDGTPLPDQRTLNLPGYPGGSDVVGNWVNGQFQLDALGEILQLLATAAHHDRLDADGHRAVFVVADVIADRWQRPDAGIWELQDDWWTHSRLACIAGLRSVAGQVSARDAAPLTALADAILAETSRRCLGDDGAWMRSPTLPRVDAALLLPPVRGALPARDPRTIATYEKVLRDLTEDGYVYRFAADDQPLGTAEGAFVMCGFTLALASWQQGDVPGALRWFERNRAVCGPPGLLAEEYDVRQRQLRGNIPQAFTHATMLETSLRLAHDPPQP
jgi:alpha,alpha-trehalase